MNFAYCSNLACKGTKKFLFTQIKIEKSPVMDDFSICIGFGHWQLASPSTKNGLKLVPPSTFLRKSLAGIKKM
jgi:hypothetical protein